MFATRVKTHILGLRGGRMPQIIHMGYQNNRSSMTIIIVYHNLALRVCISHNLWKCDISDPILTLFLISECHELFFCEIVIYFIALPLIAQTASIFQRKCEHNGVTLTLLAASQKPLVQLYPPPSKKKLQYTKKQRYALFGLGVTLWPLFLRIYTIINGPE